MLVDIVVDVLEADLTMYVFGFVSDADVAGI